MKRYKLNFVNRGRKRVTQAAAAMPLSVDVVKRSFTEGEGTIFRTYTVDDWSDDSDLVVANGPGGMMTNDIVSSVAVGTATVRDLSLSVALSQFDSLDNDWADGLFNLVADPSLGVPLANDTAATPYTALSAGTAKLAFGVGIEIEVAGDNATATGGNIVITITPASGAAYDVTLTIAPLTKVGRYTITLYIPSNVLIAELGRPRTLLLSNNLPLNAVPNNLGNGSISMKPGVGFFGTGGSGKALAFTTAGIMPFPVFASRHNPIASIARQITRDDVGELIEG